MDQLWRIEMLGWLRVVQPDRIVSRFRTRKAGALLAYLAYHPHRSHPREQLIELLWPGSVPAVGRSNLRSELASLRRQLEPPGVPSGTVLVADRATLQLNRAACTTDVGLFEAALQATERAASPAERVQRLIAAAELYRGELLPGYFEDWVVPERQRLAEAFLQALYALVALLEQRDDLPRALQWARRAVAADPLCEESHHLLIRLLLVAGQIEAARAQYEQGQHLLLQQLGTGLSPEIHALIRDLAPSKDWPPADPAGKPRKPRRLGTQSHGPQLPAAGPGPSPTPEPGEEIAPALHQSDAPARPSDNLPLRFTRFFGREREMELLRVLLQDPETKLLTLTGPGGTGKTRLSLQVARHLRDACPGGVWFVSLLDLTDPALFPDQILLSMRLPRNPHREPLEQVVASLSRAPALLLLDNFEHLVEGGAETVRTLLEQAEPLTVLITSRQCLGLEGEREFPLAPLPVPQLPAPAPARAPTRKRRSEQEHEQEHEQDFPTVLIRFPSVQLLVDRAQAVRPDFQLTAHNAAAVAALCQRLEGLPLAIELAAARAWVLTPEQMLTRVEQRFDLLVGRQRTADPRHRSLRATLDWSYQLLSPEMQRFFARLSVFRGGWTVEAAAAVGEEPKALEYLEHLRECSLVQATETAKEMRFHLLETLREYGAEQLSEEDRLAVAQQHAKFFLSLAETAEPELTGANQEFWLERLEQEHDNLRAVLTWCIESGEAQLGLRLGGALRRFWADQAYSKEGRDQLLRLLRQPGAEKGTVARAKALRAAGQFVALEDLGTARALGEESLAIWRRLNDHAGIADVLEHLGWTELMQGDLAAARTFYEESVQLYRELENQRGMADALHGLGWVVETQGDVAAGRTLVEESLTILRRLGNRRATLGSLDTLGFMTLCLRDVETARSLFEEMLATARELGDKEKIAWAILRLGWIAHYEDEYAAARALYEQCLAMWRGLAHTDGLSNTLYNLGWVLRHQGDFAAAHRVFTEMLVGTRKWMGERFIVYSLICVSLTAGDLGDWEAAAALLTESLMLFGHGERGDKIAIPLCLRALARLACARGKPVQAARLLGTAERLDGASGHSWLPAQHREFDQIASAARAQLDEGEFATAWTVGQAMPLEQALALASQEVTAG
jgi:predicted ATPase/DNA-binding SARP family transcriptional activator